MTGYAHIGALVVRLTAAACSRHGDGNTMMGSPGFCPIGHSRRYIRRFVCVGVGLVVQPAATSCGWVCTVWQSQAFRATDAPWQYLTVSARDSAWQLCL